MANSVNRILESLLPNLEELLQSGIFSEDEIRTIVQKRRRLEYSLFSNPPTLWDYLKAIEYEMNLDRLRKHRKESLGIASLSADGEFGIANRIHALYRRALKHFKANIRLWFQYIKYCEQMNQENELSRVFGRALAVHPTSTALWVMAAKFEFESRKDSKAARTIFQQAIKTTPFDQHLWIEYFRFELLYVEKLVKRREMLKLDEDDGEKLTDEILQFKLPMIVFNHAVKSIPDEVKFRLKFIEICQLFKGTRVIEDSIYDSIQSDFSGLALCWDALARRCWKNSSDEGDCLTQTKETYLEGLKHVKDEQERKHLWRLYCGWTLDHISPTGEAVKDMLLLSCEQNLITEDIALLLFNRMLQYGLVDIVSSLLDSAVLPCVPESYGVWMMKLQLIEGSVDSDGFNVLCRRAIDDMDATEHKVHLYNYWINVLLLRQQDITPVLQEAITDTKDDSIMNRLLEWSFINGGIKSVRKSFKRLESFQPLACSVYLKYLDLEHIEGTPPKIRIVADAIHRYGDGNADIWLKCIRAELCSGGAEAIGAGGLGGVAAFERVQNLHLRAVNAIKDKPTLEVFNHCYNEMMSNY